MFLGLDSSTQSLSALVIDPAAGTVAGEESVNFGQELPAYGSPSGFIPGGENGEVHADPRMWIEAIGLLFRRLGAKCDLSRIEAIACSGQQHGSVYLGPSFEMAPVFDPSARTVGGWRTLRPSTMRTSGLCTGSGSSTTS